LEHPNVLVVFTKNFGTNFTGATVATHNVLSRIHHQYEKVVVLCKNEGTHSLTGIDMRKWSRVWHVRSLINKVKQDYSDKSLVFYSDDHFGYLLRGLGRYVHAYHGNWPDARWVSPVMFLKSFYFIPQYRATLRGAHNVINVSYYMERYTRRLNPTTSVVRNGMREVTQFRAEGPASTPLKVIMLGNVDARKYGKAQDLFRLLEKQGLGQQLSIDVFGNILNQKLANTLNGYPFVQVRGYSKDFQLSDYDLFLTTSMSENLSIAVCEALKAQLPVMAFNVGGLGEVLRHLENGILVAPGKVQDSATHLKKIIEGEITFSFANTHLDEFDWDISAQRYSRLLNLS